ncbi:MAG: lysophospholipid acyltransferase family protein [Planctomycetota bacterium]
MSWLSNYRKRMPNRPLWRLFAWQFMQQLAKLLLIVLYRAKHWGSETIPAEGPVLFLANHQSFYDPILLGIGSSKRHFYSLGRSTLYDKKWSAFMGNITNSIPVEQGAGDVKAMKKCIEVLKDGQALMLFPEGARTMTGEIEKFETGAMLIIKRARPRVVPVAIEGPYDIWPRGQKRPKFSGRMGIMYGEPIAAETLNAMPAEDAMEMLRQRVIEMRQEVAQRIER